MTYVYLMNESRADGTLGIKKAVSTSLRVRAEKSIRGRINPNTLKPVLTTLTQFQLKRYHTPEYYFTTTTL